MRACSSCLADPTTCHRAPSGTGAGFTGIAIIQVPQTNLVNPPLGDFRVQDNRLFGGGGGHAIRIQSGHPHATGVVRNDVHLAPAGDLSCHRDIAAHPWSIDCGRVCDIAFVNNRLMPDVIEPACTVSCP